MEGGGPARGHESEWSDSMMRGVMVQLASSLSPRGHLVGRLPIFRPAWRFPLGFLFLVTYF